MEKEKLIQELICILDKKYGLHNITENDNLFEIKSNFTEMHMVYFVLDIIKNIIYIFQKVIFRTINLQQLVILQIKF